MPPDSPAGGQQAAGFKVRILTQAPPGPDADFELDGVGLATTVAALKTRIASHMTSHPPPTAQRLIYRGRPLTRDDATLEQVLGQNWQDSLRDSACTFHLVTSTLAQPPGPRAANPTPTYPSSSLFGSQDGRQDGRQERPGLFDGLTPPGAPFTSAPPAAPLFDGAVRGPSNLVLSSLPSTPALHGMGNSQLFGQRPQPATSAEPSETFLLRDASQNPRAILSRNAAGNANDQGRIAPPVPFSMSRPGSLFDDQNGMQVHSRNENGNVVIERTFSTLQSLGHHARPHHPHPHEAQAYQTHRTGLFDAPAYTPTHAPRSQLPGEQTQSSFQQGLGSFDLPRDHERDAFHELYTVELQNATRALAQVNQRTADALAELATAQRSSAVLHALNDELRPSGIPPSSEEQSRQDSVFSTLAEDLQRSRNPSHRASFSPDTAGPSSTRGPSQRPSNAGFAGAQPNHQQRQQHALQNAAEQLQQANINANGNVQANNNDNNNANLEHVIGGAVGNLWLLFRILMFAYVFGGTNLTSMLFLSGIMCLYYLFQSTWFAPYRTHLASHFEALFAPPQRPREPPESTQPDGASTSAPRQRMPTPEEAAARLLENRRNETRAGQRRRFEAFERAAALFLLSLWPGDGAQGIRQRLQAAAQPRAEPEAGETANTEASSSRNEQHSDNQAQQAPSAASAGEQVEDAGSHPSPVDETRAVASGVDLGSATRVERRAENDETED